jgi:DNA-binding winged helix-turn-helix (wHTH) protein/tetratricopeptide (TPR) repeat protein
MEPVPALAFGPYVLDPSERRLVREGEVVPLSPRLLALLTALAEQPGHLVPKDALIATVWTDVGVEENVLSVAVSRLRAALGLEAAYIETVPGHGYRFAAPVEHVPAAAVEPIRPFQSAAVRAVEAQRVLHRPRVLLAAGALAVVVAVGALASRPAGEAASAEPPTLLTLEPLAAPAGVPPPDPYWNAAEALAYGEHLLAMRRGLPEALAAFERAAELDPTSARAFLGIAQYHAMGVNPLPAEAALGRALALDPTLGEAHATLGFVLGIQRWDWEGARLAFERALRYAPDLPRSHQWHAVYLMVHRRFAEAEAAAERALALDPESANLHSDLCEVRLVRRDFAGARAACERALALDPVFFFARQHLFWINFHEHSPDVAARWGHKAEVFGRPGVRFTGDADAWLDALARSLTESAPSVPYDAYFLAKLQSTRGNTAASLDALALAVRQREFHVPFANADPAFDGVRDAPRFRELMEEVGLPTP